LIWSYPLQAAFEEANAMSIEEREVLARASQKPRSEMCQDDPRSRPAMTSCIKGVPGTRYIQIPLIFTTLYLQALSQYFDGFGPLRTRRVVRGEGGRGADTSPRHSILILHDRHRWIYDI
jgi:hypothetical protein